MHERRQDSLCGICNKFQPVDAPGAKIDTIVEGAVYQVAVQTGTCYDPSRSTSHLVRSGNPCDCGRFELKEHVHFPTALDNGKRPQGNRLQTYLERVTRGLITSK
jgi:hypothetical protein